MSTLENALATGFNNETDELGIEIKTKQIMRILIKNRRFIGQDCCLHELCKSCQTPHIEKIQRAISLKRSIPFVLPAFPGKSPNLAKVLGTRPDMAEILALQSLNKLCQEIKKHYAPGAHIILSSDGRVFSDIIGMEEKNVTDYLNEIDTILQEFELSHLSTFSLDEVYNVSNMDLMRKYLMDDYGSSLETLRSSVKRGGNKSDNVEDQEAHRIYCGITRFLVEDSMHPHQNKSRTAIQKDCRARAYEVILRSNAWSRLISNHFSDAVRLSIHPQTCGAIKLGIKLLGDDSWMTPWHGVAVESSSGFSLMKRWQAEKLGAEISYDSKGRMSHYKLKHPMILEGEKNAI